MKVVAWDTETGGLNPWDPKEQAFLATWADAEGEYCADLSDPAQVSQFTAALESADVLVAHNLAFDAHQTRETLGLDVLELDAELHDTDLLSRVLHPEGQNKGAQGGHGLKNLAKVYLRADADESENAIKEMAKSIGLRTIKQTGAYRDVWRAYPSVMEEYARNDARFTYDLFTKFEREIGDLRRVYELEQAVAPILIRAEQRGVKTDQEACARLKAEYEAERDQLHDYLAGELGEEALGGEGSTEALQDALVKLGVPLHRKTDTGQLATNKFALQEFEKDFEQLAKLEEFRRVEKFLATYIAALEGVDVVHPSFLQCGAWTGRMSCRRPNMQNIPKRAGKEVRSVLVPREGHSFVVVDYDSIEARLLAYYLGDQDYRQLIADGHDPHAYMAAHIWGGDMADYLKGTPGEAKRDTAKNTTYAIVYGAGAPRVADMNKISRDEARALISQIKSSLPGFYKLQKRIRTKIEDVGYVTTLLGRKNAVKKDKAYVGLNALIQGSAADIMKAGLVRVDDFVCHLSGTPLLVVHDEIVIEVPTENAEACLVQAELALTSAYDLDPPLAVSGTIAHHNYSEA